MPEYTCLWCTIIPVNKEGEVCSYECYGAWIRWHLWKGEDIIKVEEGVTILLPLELQSFYLQAWKDVT